MTGHVRAWARLFLMTAITCSLFVLRLVVWPGALVSRRVDRRIRKWILRAWAYGFAWAAGMRVKIVGPAPRPPFYLVMNHLSYLDMLILVRQTGCIFVSRNDVADWPVFGFMAKAMYVLFVDRAKRSDAARVNAEIARTIEEGDGIAVFPESRVSCGLDVLPFKSALLQPPVAMDMPVHYATISYRTPDDSPNEGDLVSWWRPEPFYTHLYRFLRHSGATATIHFGETPLRSSDRKELTQRLYAAVRGNFQPLRQSAENLEAAGMDIQTPDAGRREASDDAASD